MLIRLFLVFTYIWQQAVADPENFGGGGFEAQNLKNSDVFTKIESDFSAEIGNSNVFFAHIQVVSKKKKSLHQNWDWFFAGLVTFRSDASRIIRNRGWFFGQNRYF